MNERQIELLKKAYWNISDICSFFQVGRNKATEIRQRAIKKFDGFNPVLPQKVKRDAVLKAMDVKI